LFDIHTNGAVAPECDQLPGKSSAATATQQKQQQARTMLEAHEALCEAAPENVPRFKDVLDYLKQDLHQKTASK
jgi:hypothetical protein